MPPDRVRSLLALLILSVSLLQAGPASGHDLGGNPFSVGALARETIQFVEAESQETFEETFRAHVIEDPALAEWLAKLKRRIFQGPLNRKLLAGIDVKVLLFEGETAFVGSLPTGEILVSARLIQIMRYEEAILAILAHEIAHVARAHGYQATGFSLATARRINGFKRVPGAQAVHGVYEGLRGRFQNRTRELEADHLAMEILNNAGIDPLELPKAVERIHEFRQGQVNLHPGVLRRAYNLWETHPMASARIRSARAEIELHQYEMAGLGSYARNAEFESLLRRLIKLRPSAFY